MKKLLSLLCCLSIFLSSFAFAKTDEPLTTDLERVILIAKSKVDIPEEYSEFEYDFSSETSYSKAYWRLVWTKPDEYNGITVSIDNDGNILNYYSRADKISNPKPVYLKDELKANADSFLLKIAPDVFSKLNYQEAKFNGTYAGTYTNAGTYMVPNMGAEQASVNYVNADYKLDDPDKPILKASIVNAAAYARYNGGNNNGTIAEQAIVISGDELEGTAPIIKETMGSDGKITITVSKASGINKNPFAIKMVFSEDRKKSPSATKTITMDDVTTVDVTTEATSFTWHFKSVNVVSATGAGA